MKNQKLEDKPDNGQEPQVIANDSKPIDIEEEQKTAFFITPLGSDNSEIRRSTDGLIEAVIRPVLKEHSIYLIPPHEIKNPGTITRQIVRYILSADLVVANLTGLNPNVMYELAIRHAKRKPIIIIAENGTKLPFDLAGERTIFYQNDMAGVVALAGLLSETIPIALDDKHPENPIYNGLESLIIQEEIKGEDDPIQKYMIEKLEQLSDSVAALKNNPTSKSPGLASAILSKEIKFYGGPHIGSIKLGSGEWVNVGSRVVHLYNSLGTVLSILIDNQFMIVEFDDPAMGIKKVNINEPIHLVDQK